VGAWATVNVDSADVAPGPQPFSARTRVKYVPGAGPVTCVLVAAGCRHRHDRYGRAARRQGGFEHIAGGRWLATGLPGDHHGTARGGGGEVGGRLGHGGLCPQHSRGGEEEGQERGGERAKETNP